jgi:hypothetical protein
VAEIYVFEIEDADADGWTAEVAVLAPSRAEARRALTASGLHRKQIRHEGRPIRIGSVADLPAIAAPPHVLRRRNDDAGWTAWEPVPEGATLNWRVARRPGTGGDRR